MSDATSQSYPLTSGQQEIWFDQLLNPDTPLYTIGGYAVIEGLLDENLFRRAVQLLLNRHDALRLMLVPKEGLPQQLLAEQVDFTLPILDYRDQDDPEGAAREWMESRFAEPFSLYSSPLFEFVLLRVGEERYYWFKKYHHLITDGWGISLTLKSLAEIYNCLKKGTVVPESPCFRQQIEADGNYLSSKLFQKDQTYWQERFQQLPEPMLLPRHRAAFGTRAVPGASSTLSLSRPFYNSLKAMAADQGASPMHVLLAALYIYFTRVHKKEELVIGLPLLSRSSKAFKQTVGMFTGTIAARFDPGGQLNTSELMQQIGKQLRQDYRHQRFPLSEVYKSCNLHSNGRRQLFDLALSFEKLDLDQTRFGEAVVELRQLRHNYAQMPLELFLDDFYLDLEVKLHFCYNLAYFNSREIALLQRRFNALLHEMVERPDISIALLPLMDEEERHQLRGFSGNKATPGAQSTVMEQFEHWAKKTPTATALWFEGEETSYEQLDRAANRLACRLRSEGLDAGETVGVCIGRSPLQIIALLAVLKAGGCYLPLDGSQQPASRMQQLAIESNAKLLLIGLEQSSIFANLPIPLVFPEELITIGDQADGVSALRPAADTPAYLLYTSGSTGEPKGVLVNHDVLGLHVKAVGQSYRITPQERLLQFASPAFDAALEQILVALTNGATLVLMGGNLVGAKELGYLLDQAQVDVVDLPPGFWLQLLADSSILPVLERLRLVIVGGEPLRPAVVCKTRELLPQIDFINAYGPTEGVITASMYEIPYGPADPEAVTPIGRAVGSRRIHVLDESLQPMPIGVRGEIYLEGLLSSGYYKRPDLTTTAFVCHPVSGEILYRTGDLGCWRSDGCLEFLGRIDEQIQLRGFRIEPVEIEQMLCRHPLVREAVVSLQTNSTGERLLAHVVPGDRSYGAHADDNALETVTVEELHGWVAQRLPSYMVPSTLVVVEQLPRTAAGKIDRKKLSVAEVEPAGRKKRPATPFEQKLAAVWEDVLDQENIGRNDNFFSLGGHSLLAMQLISRIRVRFGIELPLALLFDHPVLADLAKKLENCRSAETEVIELLPSGAGLKTSFAQERIWLLCRLAGGESAYNMPWGVKVNGRLQPLALRSALQELVRRHSSLRLVFPERQGQPDLQLLLPYDPLEQIDSSTADADTWDSEMRRLAQEDAVRPFDLSSGPLFRVTLIRFSEHRHLLLFNIHHIIFDGWSIDCFNRELHKLYRNFADPNPLAHSATLIKPTIDYHDFAVWQRQQFNAGRFDAQLTYWQEELQEVPEQLVLPVDRPRSAQKMRTGCLLRQHLSKELSSNLSELSRKQGVSPFMILLASFGLLLERYSGQQEFCIGIPVANRQQSQCESLIGLFVNSVVMRYQRQAEDDFRSLLARVRRKMIAAQDHQDLPFEKVVEALHPQRSAEHTPLFQVMCAMQRSHLPLELPGLILQHMPQSSIAAKFELILNIEEAENGELGCVWEYNSDLFDRERIERMAGHLQQLLKAAVAAPRQRLSELSLLTPAETAQLQGWQEGEQYPGGRGVVERFMAVASRCGEQQAVACDTQSFSYGELEQRANHLAGQLQGEVQLEADQVVAVILPRSSYLMVGLLGVLRAGGAFLALEPDLPEERLVWMLSNSGCRAVVSVQELVLPVDLPRFDLDLPLAEAALSPAPAILPAMDSLAYVIYTSGSTGEPKGVMIEHQALANLVTALEKEVYADLASPLRIGLCASCQFDASLQQIFAALCLGHSLQVAANPTKQDGVLFSRWLQQEQIQLCDLTPSLLRLVLERAPEARYPALERLLVGGEELPPSLVRQLLAPSAHHGIRVHNLYGPSECSVDSISDCFSHDDPRLQELTLPIGRPMSNLRIQILDDHFREVPVGVPGEILISGRGLARGYLGDSALNSRRFIEVGGERCYRSGDLGQWLGDGTIAFLGRRDNQVKIRGFRIEAGEIETTLERYPALRRAVVIVEGEGGDRELVAYLEGSAPLRLEDLLVHCRRWLPQYMVPSRFMQLEQFPLSASGKIDRRRLPLEVSARRLSPDHAGRMARTPLEGQLVEIWSQVLGHSPGIDDNFFAIGGQSLKAARVIGAISARLKLQVGLRDLFNSPTIAELAELLQRRQPCRFLPLEPLVEASSYPVSHGQHRLWILDQFEGAGLAYLMPARFRLRGNFNAVAFRQGLDALIHRHEILRTRFIQQEDEVHQVVDSAGTSFIQKDLRKYPEDSCDQVVGEFFSQPFDLETGPLFRTLLVREADESWQLAFGVHHIICDGLSAGLLTRELSQFYSAFTSGESPALEPLALQYKEYAAWQRRLLSEEHLAEQRRYWLEQLAAPLPVLQLPTDRQRPVLKSYRGESLKLELAEMQRPMLSQLASEHGVTVYMVVVALVNVLLHRYTGADEIIVGAPAAGRNRLELEDQIGFYVNTLALRSRLNGQESFTALLHQVQQTVSEAFDNQDYPFDRLVEELELQRDTGRSPLFDVMVAYETAETVTSLELDGIHVEPVESGIERVKFDLSFTFTEATGLSLELEYNSDLFDRERIERMAGHLQQLLKAAVAAPRQRLSELSLLTPAETAQLQGWQEGEQYPGGRGVVERFMAVASRCGEQQAVACDTQSFSYGELEQRANHLAGQLQGEVQLEADQVVAVILPRSSYLMVGLLGVLRAGGAFLALEPDLPEERLVWMLSNSGCRAVVSVQELVLPVDLPRFDLDLPLAEAALSPAPAILPAMDSLAYVIYTSGSTGEPKGVMIEHQALANLVTALEKEVYADLASPLRIGLCASCQFDASLQQIFAALCLGHSLQVAANPTKQDGVLFSRWLQQEQIQLCDLTPSLLRLVLERAPEARYPALERLLVGGEELPPSLVRQLLAPSAHHGIRVHNLYGPSECSVDSISDCFSHDDPRLQELTLPIGRPMSNLRIQILDDHFREVPVGVPGEIVISGRGLARGYLGDSALSSRRFIEIGGERCYRSGDLGQWLGDGTIAFLGRRDNQVKIRGFRIEAGEIETTLERYPALRGAVVIVEGEGGDRELVAYLEGSAPLRLEDLLVHCRRWLPQYMVPSRFIQLEQLSLSASGKIDRRRLPLEVSARRLSPDHAGRMARTSLEGQLVEIWSQVLGHNPGIDDNFFAIGGQSLKAARVIGAISARLKLQVGLRDLFNSPTIAELAELLQRRQPCRFLPLEPLVEASSYPVSHGQHRLWILDQFEGAGLAYLMPARFRLRGNFNAVAFRQGLDALIHRHEILRTRFIQQEDEVHQVVDSAGTSFIQKDLRKYPEDSCDQVVGEFFSQPFDLETGPLFRTLLVREADESWQLAFGVHHIICDGLSAGLLTRELSQFYSAFTSGESPALEPLALQYKEYAAWQRRLLSEEHLAEQRRYWLEQLAAPLPVLQLPTDRQRPVLKSYRGESLKLELAEMQRPMLSQLASEHGVTVYMVVVALVNVLLHRYTGADEIIVGAPAAGRNRLELEDQIGFYVNTLALRSRLNGQESFTALLHQVQQTVSEAFDNQDYPFDRLVEELELQRDTGRSPLFDVMVAYETAETVTSLELDGIHVEPVESGIERVKFDLSFTFTEATGLSLELEYNSDLFDRERIERMAGHLQQLLESTARDPLQPLKKLQIIDDREREELTVGCNPAPSQWPQSATLVSLFDRQACRTPEAIALVRGEEQCSYRELDELAARICSGLQQQGLAPGEAVGVCLHPSIQLIAAILGVLKAGGCYVPVDPRYPEQRQLFMLQDSGCRLLLSDQALPVVESMIQIDPAELPGCGAAQKARSILPHSPAYIIYTSGSTGRPKGCVVSHSNVVRLLFNDAFPFDFDSEDVWVMAHSACFDFSVWELFGALLRGGRLVVPDVEEVRDTERFLALLDRHQVSILNQTPGSFSNLSRVAVENRAELRALRLVIFGGDRLEPATLKGWVRRFPLEQVQLINMYGISETTVHVTWYPLQKADIFEADGSSPIGSPLPTVTVYICDDAGHPVPAGVTGELYVGGDGVCLGYHEKAELTAEHFLVSPFVNGERLYRTGDLGRYRLDGTLEYLGRNDQQVQVRGYRIEPGEIEAALLDHPTVSEAAVVARNNDEGEQHLIAYLVMEQMVELEPLRRHLRGRLAEYMLPAYFVRLAELPLTANNKLDRRALPDPQAGEGTLITDNGIYQAARTPLEGQLVILWQDLLGREVVGIHDNYFALGGDSIKVLRLADNMARTLGRRLPLAALFRYPTVAQLAGFLEADQLLTDGPDLAPVYQQLEKMRKHLQLKEDQTIPLDGVEDLYPMSDIQLGMIYHALAAGQGVYHDQFYIQFVSHDFDPIRFARALELLVERHSILRTGFALAGFDEPLQLVHRRLDKPIADYLTYEDLQFSEREEQRQHLRMKQKDDLAAPFDPARPGLWRFSLYSLGDQEYGLLWSFHHAILDGWSNAAMLNELLRTTSALGRNPDFRPSPLAGSYRDFVTEQMAHKDWPGHVSFWQQTLRDWELTPLPLQRSANRRSNRGVTEYQVDLDRQLTRQVAKAGMVLQTGEQPLFLAAFTALLRFTTNRSDLLFGLVSHNRPEIEKSDEILGCFLNSVPLRIHLRNDLSGQHLVHKLRDQLVEIRLHDRFPLSEISSLVGAGGSEQRLFDILFNYVDFHVAAGLDDLIELRNPLVEEGFENTDTGMVFTISRTGSVTRIRIAAAAGIYSTYQLESLVNWFRSILKHLTENPERCLDPHLILDDREREELTVGCNPAPSQWPQSATLVSLFDRQACRTPEAIALVRGEEQCSYRELDELAARICSGLQQQGLAPGEAVGVCLHPSIQLIAAILGVLKAGGCYVPVDPRYPEQRQLFMLQDSGCRLLLSDQALPVVESMIQIDPAELPGCGAAQKARSILPHSPAYIIYTSGSTGRPKGCVVSHSNVVRLLFNDAFPFDFDSEDVWVMAHSACFDFSVWELFGALLRGGRLVVPDVEEVRDTERFLALLDRHQVSILNQTPGSFSNLSRVAEDNRAELRALRLVIFGGDRLEPATLKGWVRRFPLEQVQLINMYGISETTVHVTWYPLQKADIFEADGSSPIGSPLPTVTVYICDDAGHPVPAGVTGELYVGGDGVCLGYHEKAELTAEHFLVSPFVNGERLYRTGDLGRYRLDGTLEYLGRNDQQVQVRGYRIEPGEIEAALLDHPAVSEAAVVARNNDEGEQHLIAYLVMEQMVELEPLRRHLRGRLAEYMLPAYFVRLAELPLTVNNKLDRRALPDPQAGEGTLIADNGIYQAARTPLEGQLVILWQDLLGREVVGIHDNYFALGGDSIKVLRLVGAIRKQLDLAAEIRDVFHWPTIAQLACRLVGKEELVSRQASHAFALLDEKERAQLTDEVEDAYPLSSLQGGMLFHSEFSPDSPVYHDIFSLHLRFPLDVSRIRRVISTLVQSHPVLRTGFELSRFRRPLQLVHRHVESILDIIDLRNITQTEQDEAVRQWIATEKGNGFDWSRPPLLRFCLHLRGENRCSLSLSFHHAILDGWSVAALLTELFCHYLADMGRTIVLQPAPRLLFRDFIAAEQQATVDTASARFWRKTLADMSFVGLPRWPGFPLQDEGEVRVERLGIEPVDISAVVSEQLRSLARQEGLPLKSLLLAAHIRVMGFLCNQEDVVTGLVQNGRLAEEEGDRVLGLFLNTLPFRVHLTSESWRTLAHRVHVIEQESMPYRRYPLTEIQRSFNGRTLFESAFNFTHFHVYEKLLALDDSIQVLDEQFFEQTNFVLGVDFGLDPVSGQISLDLDYNGLELAVDQVRAIAGYYSRALEAMALTPDDDHSFFSPLSDREREQLLIDWNATASDYPRNASLQQLFEEHAAVAPHRLALSFAGQELSYGELNSRVNRLSHLLRRHGVQRGTVVALLDERSPEIVTAMLATVKAGGCYLPLDPQWPQERVRRLLQDSGAGLVISCSPILKMQPFTTLQQLQLLDDELIQTGRREPIKDLDSLPYPDRSLVDYHKYDQYIGEACVRRNISIYATRGCPFKCRYCHKIWPKVHHIRSAENIFAEVRQHYDKGYDTFSFIDDIFNLDRRNSSRFFELVLQHNLKLRILFPNGLKGDLLNAEQIDLMAEAGVIQMALALETASPRLQKLIGKNLNIDRLQATISHITSHHPQIILDLFTMFGFPTETEAEVEQTLDFIRNVHWLHFPTLNALKIFPNTDMAELAIAHGVSREAIERSAYLSYHDPGETMPFSAAFAREFQNRYLNDYFLSEERLQAVIPAQKKVLSHEEIMAKYATYLPGKLEDYPEVLQLIKAEPPSRPEPMTAIRQEVEVNPRKSAPKTRQAKEPLRLLLLDLSQLFSDSNYQLNELVEAPLGLISLLTYLNREFGERLDGRIRKAMVDFDSFAALEKEVVDFRPQIIGIRTLSLYRHFFHETVSLLRAWCPEAQIVTGGPYATSEFATLLSDVNLDLVVLGEGELIMRDIIATSLSNNGTPWEDEQLKEITGLAFLPRKERLRRRCTLGEGVRQVMLLDQLSSVLEGESAANPPLVNRAADPAYIMYTSGSTGSPKGVVVDQRAVIRLVRNSNYVDLGPQERMLQFAPLSFDASTFEIWGALLNGCSLEVMAAGVPSLPELGRVIREKRITTLWLTAGLFHLMVDEQVADFAGVRQLLAGGDILSPGHVTRLLQSCPELVLINGYGPTEGTTFSCCYPMRAVEPGLRTIPIGRPVANSRAYILNPDRQLVAVGTAGELYIGGDGLAQGYLGNPGLTADCFVADPFATEGGGGRLYRTGDLCRYLPDGRIEFLGRIDHQVKISGYRIEPGEVESHLRNLPEIKDALVVSTGSNLDKHLVAYLLLEEQAEAIKDELQGILRQVLPEYMLPAAFVILEQFPLTANGKVDRSRLPAPGGTSRAPANRVAPRTLLEQRIGSLWQELLAVEQVSIHDNFFELGGNSILMVQLNKKLQTLLNRPVSMVDMFRAPTIARLALQLEGAGENNEAEDEGEKRAERRTERSRTLARQRLMRRNMNKNRN
ncbi:non-ribosomal peptide synthase/polyketide synthase [Desulfopila sp. IMCC35008]|uniref:non-ribosomal peptide synthase/polyketide synthase n=1 Tax=Desulfopila sp. IMCC35008 TaxID=2653858 RepID=UPI0027152A8B|nr:non-ribosomal peptide synthase/polyketide synthase [Desulfopila sp. IMCC35008]